MQNIAYLWCIWQEIRNILLLISQEFSVREYASAEVGFAETIWAVVDAVFAKSIDALSDSPEGAFARDTFEVDVDV